MAETPLVSILIPCYNAVQWIAEAIRSAQAQTWPNCEIIVVDDGSIDGSIEVLRSFEREIRWETGPNQGGNVARNRLLKLANGQWLQYLDADDALLPDKIANQMEHLKDKPDVDVIYGPSTFLYHEAGRIRREVCPIPQPHDPWILLVRWFLPQTGSPLWRKQAIVDVGGWKPDQPCCQEHELYSRLLIEGKSFLYAHEGGSLYRQWSTGTVCRKNIELVHTKRIEIINRVETHLRGHGLWSPDRSFATNMARFEVARMRWLYNREGARELWHLIKRSDPGFVPSGAAAPPSFQLCLNLLGYSSAESIAHALRSFRKLIGRSP